VIAIMRPVRLLFAVGVAWAVLSMHVAEQAEAGVVDRIKDIYYAPDKVEELQETYTENMQRLDEQLDAQRAQLEESRQQVDRMRQQQEALMQANAGYQDENAALQAQNEALLGRMEQMENDRKSLIRNIAVTVGSIMGLLLLYAVSIRVWRYLAWRRHSGKHDGHEAMTR
jgi:FtsZ-binding cell division protein ZapB